MRARFPVILQHMINQRIDNLLATEQRAGQLVLNLQLSRQVATRFVHTGPPNLAVLTDGRWKDDVLFVLTLTPFRSVGCAHQCVVAQRAPVQRRIVRSATTDAIFLDVICTDGWLD